MNNMNNTSNIEGGYSGYYGFINNTNNENINAVFKTGFALKYIVLPLGISFFTLQQISFIIDRPERMSMPARECSSR